MVMNPSFDPYFCESCRRFHHRPMEFCSCGCCQGLTETTTELIFADFVEWQGVKYKPVGPVKMKIQVAADDPRAGVIRSLSDEI